VLEYGCGAGTYSAILAARGARVTGIDISDVAPLALPLRNTRVLNTILDVLNGVDRLTFALCPPMKRYAWQVVSVLEKPRKVLG
jgi:SAM-dependent methyltransferase